MTITKAITIDGGGGQIASILGGTNGIIVQAGANDVVTLRNLPINGIVGTGSGGLNGIRYLSGVALHVEDCYIFGFTQDGINVATSAANASLFVNNTFLTNNGNGIQVAPTADNVRSMLVHVWSQGNSGTGFLLNTGAGVTGTVINESSALVNGTGIGVAGGKLFLGNSTVIRNNVGVAITGGSVAPTRPTCRRQYHGRHAAARYAAQLVLRCHRSSMRGAVMAQCFGLVTVRPLQYLRVRPFCSHAHLRSATENLAM